MIVCVIHVLAMLLCHSALIDCVTMLVSLCAINHMLLCLRTHTMTSLMHCICLVIFATGSWKVRFTFLIACVGHHGNDCE